MQEEKSVQTALLIPADGLRQRQVKQLDRRNDWAGLGSSEATQRRTQRRDVGCGDQQWVSPANLVPPVVP